LAKLEAQSALDAARDQARQLIKQAIATSVPKTVPEGEQKVVVTKKHEKECHKPDIFVGANNVPAKETRSVMLMGNKEAHAALYNSVKTDSRMMIDPHKIREYQKAVPMHDKAIMSVHNKVQKIAEAPLVPDSAIPKEDDRSSFT